MSVCSVYFGSFNIFGEFWCVWGCLLGVFECVWDVQGAFVCGWGVFCSDVRGLDVLNVFWVCLDDFCKYFGVF